MTAANKVLYLKNCQINCREFFNINWSCWKLLGIVKPCKHNAHTKSQQLMFIAHHVWNGFVSFTVTFLFPLHIVMGLLTLDGTQEKLFEALAICVTSTGGSLKLVAFAFSMKNIIRMELLLKTLDERIRHPEDKQFFSRHIKRTMCIMERMYLVVYVTTVISVLLAAFMRGRETLIYPGWLPFDWHGSWQRYSVAFSFQLFCVTCQAVQHFTTDIFSPKALCILTGQTNLLYQRVSRIGHDATLSLHEHEMELNKSIGHQRDLYELLDTIQSIVSWPLFLQLFFSLANIGVGLVVLVFYANDFFYRVYYVMYFMAMALQLLPVSYYGSYLVNRLENLHHAAFACNWTAQSQRFKRHMMLFTERSLKGTIIMAGGVFPIHLATFLSTCKGAYSMFTLLIKMK